MTVQDVVTIIQAIGVLAGVVLSGWAAILAAKAKRYAQDASETGSGNSDKLKDIHEATNGMKDQLVEAVRTAAFFRGKEEGRKNDSGSDGR